MSARWRSPKAAAAPAVTAVVLVAAALVLQAMGGPADVAETLLPLVFVAIGYIVATRVPDNALGWVFSAVAVIMALGQAADSLFFVARDQWNMAGVAGAAALLSSWPWFAGIGLIATFCLLLFPDGRLPSRRWRPVAWAAGAAILGGCAGLVAITATHLEESVTDPYGDIGEGSLLEVAALVVGLLLVGAALASIASLFVRWRRASGVARQQLKWFGFGGLVQLLGVAAGVGTWLPDGVQSFVAEVTVLALPVAGALAILRYRLYDIDRLLSRTVSYAVLTAVVVGVYLGGVTLLTTVTASRAGESPIAVAAATLLAAAAFGPARRRIQTLVDSRFNRARYDAARTAEAYRARLREQLDLEAITGDLLATAGATVQPTTATVWLRPGGAR